MTKRDAAYECLGLAHAIAGAMGDDDGAAVWTMRLVWLAAALHPPIIDHPRYVAIVAGIGVDTRAAKLRRLIDHPNTPAAERDAAIAALDRVDM